MGQEFRAMARRFGKSEPDYLIYAQLQQSDDNEFWTRSPFYDDNLPVQRSHEANIQYQEKWFPTEQEAYDFILDAFAVLMHKCNITLWNGSIIFDFQPIDIFECDIPHAWSTKALVGMAKAGYFEHLAKRKSSYLAS